MRVRDETAVTPGETGAERRETEAYLKQYVEVTRGEPTRLAAELAARFVAAASQRLQ